ncbi:MAG TPA: YchJ family protein, partial [Agitococcus sp.]|nr:YchJ family protein [Agitococcus sp.]
MKKTDVCPCGSSNIYQDCCQRFWASQQTAQTAEELMRSRYTAFVLEKAQYLVDTHHSTHRQADELKALKKSFKHTQWLGLEVMDKEQGQANDHTGIVEFKAHFKSLGKNHVLHERSQFVKEQGKWFYTTGTIYQ